MRIKQNNPLPILTRAPVPAKPRSGARTIGLVCLFMLAAGFYVGGYTAVPGLLNTRLKELSRFNLVWAKNYLKGRASHPKRLVIDIKHKNFQFLEYKRAAALKKGVLITQDDSYVPAKLTADGKTVPVRIRLKGDLTDHLEGDKWSFRINVRGDEAVWGMRSFSIQDPKRSGWGHEWVMYEWFKKEGLIALRYDFVEVIINGRNLGIFALEESFGKELIEHNQRREGPILKWDESALFDPDLTTGGDTAGEPDLFYAADVTSFKTGKMFADKTLRDLFYTGRDMLLALRNGQAAFSDVFDVERAAKTVAILEIINAVHGVRWKNCRFYMNPVTGRLELIAYNAFAPHPIMPINEQQNLFYTAHRQRLLKLGIYEWRDLFFSDRGFVEAYFAALDRFTAPGYLESFFKEIGPALRQTEGVIFRDYPRHPVLVPVYFHNRDMIRSFLHPKLPLKVSLKGYDGNNMRLAVANPTFLPVMIDGLVSEKTGAFFQWSGQGPLDGKTSGLPLTYVDVTVPLPGTAESDSVTIFQGDMLALEGWRLQYHIPGLGEKKTALIDAQSLLFSAFLPAADQGRQGLPAAVENGWMRVDDERRIVAVTPGRHPIDADIVVPAGYKLRIGPATELLLNKGAAVISYGPVEITGNEENPVVFRSADGTGQGLVLLSAGERSVIRHVVFSDLAALDRENWRLTGAVTVYETAVEIDHVRFHHNRSEDFLNIVRSKFLISGASFDDSYGDALDVDFCEGLIADSGFVSCANDCLDFSGSRVEARGLEINGAGDKGVSVGEQSFVKITASSVKRATIALACKDSSVAYVDNLHVSDAETGFAVYRKKPEFGGGRIIVTGTTMVNVKDRFVGDDGSVIEENGKTMAMVPPGDHILGE